MNIISPEIQDYISNLCRHLSPELEELERQTYLKVLLPNMISGKEQGNFLYHFVKAKNPKKVLEIGTFTGYSAICMAMAMEDDATLITIDINDEIAYLANEYFVKTKQSHKIIYKNANALDLVHDFEDNSLDIIFIDADKKNYPKYFELYHKKLKNSGFILIDNVLWKGKVLDSLPDMDTKAIQSVNKMVFEDTNFISNIVPIRDGILIAQKKYF